MSSPVRLQKYMAWCGVASRRKCEQMIARGRVSVNGRVVTGMGVKIRPGIDEVRVDGRLVVPENKKVYILLNKPRGYITAVRDPFGRPTVLELVGEQKYRIYPVGRLDLDTEGLLILTNDGEFAFRLTHPRHQIEKEYYAVVAGCPRKEQIERLRSGIDLGDFVTSPARVIKLGHLGKDTAFRIVIREGKKRQVRRMFEAIGHPVKFLRRERIGNIRLGSLKPGQWRYLTEEEIEKLKGCSGEG